MPLAVRTAVGSWRGLSISRAAANVLPAGACAAYYRAGVQSTALSLPAILVGPVEPAAGLLTTYVTKHLADGSGPYFAGARFSSFAPDRDPDRIIAEDILAVTMLGVDFPPAATLRLLEDEATTASDLLTGIPQDVDLADARHEHIGRESCAWRLWNLVDGLHGVGPTLTSKLLARKRPRLLPIQDRVVSAAVGLAPDGDLWSGLRELLTRDDRALVTRLRQIREAADVGEGFSDIRVFDIVVWMWAHA